MVTNLHGRQNAATDLRAIDMKLLVIFDALMQERHVSRAALRIPMSQPAVSNALTRLRHLFKDELFIRCGGAMEPTPRAVELSDSVSQILRQAERLMSSDLHFDPVTTQREFTASMSDLVGSLVLPPVLATLSENAPQVSLDMLLMSPDRRIKALESGHLDFVLSMESQDATNIRRDNLFRDQLVCVMRSDHELAQGELTLEQFLDADQLRVAMSSADVRCVDDVLAAQGYSRRVVAKIPHWLLIPPILLESQLIAVISSKLAGRLDLNSIAVRPLPFPTEPFYWAIYWHRRNDNSLSHQWMRELILNTCAAL